MTTNTISCPYTCGELFQGTLDGAPCLVSCPVAIYSTAEVTPGLPQSPLPEKSQRALRGLPIHSLPPIALHQRLPASRGYGTSTADIGSVVTSAARWAGLTLDPLQISRMAIAIEPTDSSLIPGLALFDHRGGKFCEFLGAQPPIAIIIIDPGGEVDSENFNNQDWTTELKRIAPIHRDAFDLLKDGIARQDVGAVGEAATISAKAHQDILYNPWLDVVLELALETKACGICRAHSGTILGLMFPMETFDRENLLSYLRGHFPAPVRLLATELSGGGPVDHTPIVSDKVGFNDC